MSIVQGLWTATADPGRSPASHHQMISIGTSISIPVIVPNRWTTDVISIAMGTTGTIHRPVSDYAVHNRFHGMLF